MCVLAVRVSCDHNQLSQEKKCFNAERNVRNKYRDENRKAEWEGMKTEDRRKLVIQNKQELAQGKARNIIITEQAGGCGKLPIAC
jgi:hypothetical protein